jgi:hypothetical protein
LLHLSVMTRQPRARFLLHQATRKRLVRVALLFLGVIPAVFMGIATLVYWSPYYQSRLKKDWESRVTANLGVRVLSGGFGLLGPGQFVATDVVLFHPETDVPMAKVRQVAGLIKPQGWSIVLEDPKLDASQLQSTLGLLHDGFLCKPQTRERMLAISVPNGLEVHHHSGLTKLGQVEILMKPTENRSAIVSRFAYAEQPFGEIQLQVVRDHSPDNLSTRIEVRSPKSWIACSNFSEHIPWVKALGETAQFRGLLKAQWSTHGWDAIVEGEFDRVQFARMTSSVGSPFKGLGSVSLGSLNLCDGQIVYAQGRLDCQQGSFQADWIQKAAQWLQLPAKWEATLSESQLIDAFAVTFELSPEGLRLGGQLPGPSQWPPVALKLSQATLCTPQAPIPLTSLVAAFQAIPGPANQGSSAVDLNAMYLASILPWPKSVSETQKQPSEQQVSRLSHAQAGPENPVR